MRDVSQSPARRYSYLLVDNQCAIEDYNQAIKINPQSADGYFHSGEYRDELGDMQGAIEYYTQAIKMNPNYAYAYEKRGVARSALGDKQGAIKDFRIAANMYKKEGKKTAYQEAMEEIRKINK